MRLSALFEGICRIAPDQDREVSGLCLDSRRIKACEIFFVLPSALRHGTDFLQEAIFKQAVAIVVDGDFSHLNCPIPIITLPHLMHQLGEIAARFYGYPSKQLRFIGVTGTNGKTSCTHFIAQVLQFLSVRCGVIGTLGSGVYGDLTETGYTTPDAIMLQGLLRDLVSKQVQRVAMEVTSHSIAQERIHTLSFDTGIFTNLTQDHLDYHGDMETYAAVKYRFLAEDFTRQVIINRDDERGRAFIKSLASHKPVFSYSISDAKNTHGDHRVSSLVPHVDAKNVRLSAAGICAKVYSPWGNGELHLPLMGEFNLGNALAALIALCLDGYDFEKILEAISQMKPIPGRMQTWRRANGALIVVDFAHTPDALEKVLMSLRAHTDRKVICVFGCGGDRDSAKRPLMARIAEQFADHVIVTQDNPRHEDPLKIMEDIRSGFLHPDKVQMISDRSQAIEMGIQLAGPSDCVLIAGKGAERYQQIGDIKHPFDDTEHVQKYL